MNDETTRIAERYGITEKCASLERDLLSIDGVTSVEFDLNGFLDDIHQVIVLVGYDFHIVTRKLRLAVDVVNTAYLHGLEESGDRIEDYGEHLYLVFNCGPSWRCGHDYCYQRERCGSYDAALQGNGNGDGRRPE